MIKVKNFLTTIALISVTSSLYAVQFEITPTVSKAFKASDDSLQDDEILYGLRANIFLNKEIALQVGLEASTENIMSDQGKTDIERGLLNIIYENDFGTKIRPYTLVGGGYERVHRESTPKTDDDSQSFINVGVGLKYDINDRVNLMTEARWLKKLENNDEDIIATIGIGIKIGDVKKKSNIPSVTETTAVENAISLVKFRELQKNKKVVVAPKPVIEEKVSVITETSSIVDNSEIPANAIILGEDESIDMADIIVTEDTNIDDSTSSDSGYYVQLAALFKGNGKDLTNRLEQKNYHYIQHKVQRHSKKATLILVGPYESRVEAGIALKYLKRVKSDAFIYFMN